MLKNIENTITHLAMDQLGRNLAGRILSLSRHVRHNAVAMAKAVALQRRAGQSAVMGVWRTNVWIILMKFGIQQQIRTTMTVTWSNIKIFKIKKGGRSLLENIRNAITRLPMDRLDATWVIASHHVPNRAYWKCYNSSYDGTDWDDSWVVASKQHFCCNNRFFGIRRYC